MDWFILRQKLSFRFWLECSIPKYFCQTGTKAMSLNNGIILPKETAKQETFLFSGRNSIQRSTLLLRPRYHGIYFSLFVLLAIKIPIHEKKNKTRRIPIL